MEWLLTIQRLCFERDGIAEALLRFYQFVPVSGHESDDAERPRCRDSRGGSSSSRHSAKSRAQHGDEVEGLCEVAKLTMHVRE